MGMNTWRSPKVGRETRMKGRGHNSLGERRGENGGMLLERMRLALLPLLVMAATGGTGHYPCL